MEVKVIHIKSHYKLKKIKHLKFNLPFYYSNLTVGIDSSKDALFSVGSVPFI